MRTPPIVLADPDGGRRQGIQSTASACGFTLEATGDFTQAASLCRVLQPKAVLVACDETTRDEALRAVADIRRSGPGLPILFVVEHGSEAFAVAALRAGVTDYLRYPLDRQELAASLTRSPTGAPAPARSTPPVGRPGLIGSSAAMKRVQTYLDQAAHGEANVLITGETGTGKELAAIYLHEHSGRRRRRFVPINCAAIPDTLLENELFGHERGAFTGASATHAGLLESADGGTVFLDEIGEMGLPAQAKILRAIEAREVYRLGGRGRIPLDIRIVAATNEDLETAVETGRFRKDLYYRLHVASVRLPPLRERRGDISELLDHYLHAFNAHAARQVHLSEDARTALDSYEWPGNVRELKNLVESLFVWPASGPVRIEDLPETFRRRLERFCSAGDPERRALLDALFAARWNKSRAAEILECSRMTLYRRMAKHAVVRSSDDRSTQRSVTPGVTSRVTANSRIKAGHR
jgi:DNA-binding NtrC family response regulator